MKQETPYQIAMILFLILILGLSIYLFYSSKLYYRIDDFKIKIKTFNELTKHITTNQSVLCDITNDKCILVVKTGGEDGAW